MVVIGSVGGAFCIVPLGAVFVQFAVVELVVVFGLAVTPVLGSLLVLVFVFVLVLVLVPVVLVVVVALVAVPGGHGVVVVVEEFVVVVLGVVVVGCVVVVCAKAGRAILTTSPPMDARPRIARELMRLILLGKQ